MNPTVKRLSPILILALLMVVPLAALSRTARAAQAVVAVAQRVTEKKVGNSNWQRAAKGTPLDANNRFRTGKRSSADLKFRDGSLLRLGQLSMVELRGGKNVSLLGGKLLFSMLKGGRVVAGGAAAAIKGSVGIIEWRDDGSVDFTLYSGAMDVETPQATVTVAPGTRVNVAPDGTISLPQRVAILPYAGNTLHPELLTPPSEGPFAGSPPHTLSLYDPTRIALDAAIPLSQNAQFGPLTQAGVDVYPSPQSLLGAAAPILNFYDPFGPPPAELGGIAAGNFSGTFDNGEYTITQINGRPVNYPTQAFIGFPAGQQFSGTFTGNYVVAAPGQNAGQTVTFTENNGDVSTLITFADPATQTAGYSYVTPGGQLLTGLFNPSLSTTVALQATRQLSTREAPRALPMGRSGGVALSSNGGPLLFLRHSFGTQNHRLAQAGEQAGEAANAPSNTLDAIVPDAVLPDADDTPIDLDLSEAYRHIEEVSTREGRSRGGDLTVSGVYTDEGANVIGAYLHGAVSRGPFLLDGTLRPLRVEANGRSENFSAISDLSLTYRDWRGEVQLGRQRFLRGPAQITLFGSLVRQGGREVMDALRIAPDIGAGRQLELAYIQDAFPRDLPYRIGGSQKGLYGRFALQKRAGNFGLNVLHYLDTPGPSTTGYSLDFAVPLQRDSIELYGEVGRDMFRRRLTTVGLAFPGLYDRTDYDLYLEYSNLGDGDAITPPDELSARVYHRFNKNVSGVLAVSRFSNLDTKMTLGLAFGTGNSTFGR